MANMYIQSMWVINKDDSTLAVHFKTKGISIGIRAQHCNYEAHYSKTYRRRLGSSFVVTTLP